MIKRFFYLILTILFISPCSLRADGDKKSLDIAVISDIHIMAPSLLVKDGNAFENYVKHDRKMLKEGPGILNEVINRLLKARPQVVLVTGDLTKDGASVSHHYVVNNYLSRLKAAGIRTLVIPGNHDINNPHAVSYDGDSTQRVPTVSAKEFATCYADYGYGDAIARDSFSLSYVSQLSDSLRILAIDACRYEENSYDKDICVTGGRIKPETLEFIRTQAKEARLKGIRMLAMMHHGLVQHWTWQNKAMKGYLVENWKKNAGIFTKSGIEIVFTGHFHAQDITRYRNKHNTLYDIETGSTVSYPSPYRLVSLKDETLTISTHRIDSLNGKSLEPYFRKYAIEGISTIISHMLPTSIPEDSRKEACDVMGQAYVNHLAGDEKINDDFKDAIRHASRNLRRHSWKYAFLLKHLARSLSTDLSPEDNDIIIHLQK